MQNTKERNIQVACVFQVRAHISTVVLETKSCSILRADLCYEMFVNDVSPYNSHNLAQ